MPRRRCLVMFREGFPQHHGETDGYDDPWQTYHDESKAGCYVSFCACCLCDMVAVAALCDLVITLYVHFFVEKESA